MTLFCERVGLGRKSTVLCESMNQAASYWSSVPHHPIVFLQELVGHDPPLVTPLVAHLTKLLGEICLDNHFLNICCLKITFKNTSKLV